MSLSDLNLASAADQGAVLKVLHPENQAPFEGAGGELVTLTLLGKDSDEWVRAERKSKQALREGLMRRQKYSAAGEDHSEALALAAVTKGWTGIPLAWLEPGGKDESPAPFTPENAGKLYANRGVRWIREQADEFIADRANFLKASTTS